MSKSSEHERATIAWSDSGKRSPTAGLTEMCQPSTRKHNPAVRASQQAALRKRQQAAWAGNRQTISRGPDNSRYFPHQSVREMARRIRQMGRLLPDAMALNDRLTERN